MRITAAIAAFLLAATPVAAGELTVETARIHRALQRAPGAPRLALAVRAAGDATRLQAPAPQPRDSVWNGALIGGGIGVVGGFIWARSSCGANDTECFYIAGPVGILGGAAIGAAAGAIIDKLHK